MSNRKSARLIASLREFLAEMIGQLVLYVTLLGALTAWFYFKTIYAPLIVGAGGLLVFWMVYGLILGQKKEKRIGPPS